jgi:hypothetical protein
MGLPLPVNYDRRADITEEEVVAARLVVCGNAHDVDDARLLLEATGLDGPLSRWVRSANKGRGRDE